MNRARKYMINSIKMLPHNDESIALMKEMLIRYIKEDKRYTDES